MMSLVSGSVTLFLIRISKCLSTGTTFSSQTSKCHNYRGIKHVNFEKRIETLLGTYFGMNANLSDTVLENLYDNYCHTCYCD